MIRESCDARKVIAGVALSRVGETIGCSLLTAVELSCENALDAHIKRTVATSEENWARIRLENTLITGTAGDNPEVPAGVNEMQSVREDQ